MKSDEFLFSMSNIDNTSIIINTVKIVVQLNSINIVQIKIIGKSLIFFFILHDILLFICFIIKAV